MDWKELGKKLVGLGARVAGGALAGPAGAVVGGVIADALGVDADPAVIADAIDADPAATEAVVRLEPELPAAIYQHATAAIRAANETMRAEMVSHSPLQRLWRPLWGIGAHLVWAATGAMLVVAIAAALWTGRAEVFSAIAENLSALAWFYTAPLAVIGVAAWGRTTEKTAAITGRRPVGMIEALARRIAPDR